MKFSNEKLKRYYERKLHRLERSRADIARKIDRAYAQMDMSSALVLEESYAKVMANIALVTSLVRKYQPLPAAI